MISGRVFLFPIITISRTTNKLLEEEIVAAEESRVLSSVRRLSSTPAFCADKFPQKTSTNMSQKKYCLFLCINTHATRSTKLAEFLTRKREWTKIFRSSDSSSGSHNYRAARCCIILRQKNISRCIRISGTLQRYQRFQAG